MRSKTGNVYQSFFFMRVPQGMSATPSTLVRDIAGAGGAFNR